jgi:hypothetical protein
MKITIKGSILSTVLNSALGYQDECLLNLEREGIIVRVRHSSDAGFYASMIEEEAIEEYDRGQYNKLGIRMQNVLDFIPNDDTTVTISIVEGRLCVNRGDREIYMSTIDTDAIHGNPDSIPDINNPVVIHDGVEWVVDFAQDAYSYIFSNDDEAVIISARDGMLYLYAGDEMDELVEKKHWEDFDDYSIDWSSCSESGQCRPEDVNYSPEEDHVVNTIVSTKFLRPIMDVDGETAISMDNHMPFKAVTTTDYGVKHSWFVAPRIPSQGKALDIPDRVLEDRGL